MEGDVEERKSTVVKEECVSEEVLSQGGPVWSATGA